MKNLKRIFSAIISLTMVLSLFGAFSAQAAETEYTFYTQVGASFTPETEGVIWNDTASIDTSVMGRQVIYGTKDGVTVKGIVNVGTQKWLSYQNNEGKRVDSDLVRSVTDEWRYESGDDVGTQLGVYVADPENSNNTVVKYSGGKNSSGSNYNQIAYYPKTKTTAGNSYSIEFRFRADSTGINIDADDTYSIMFRTNNDGSDTFNLKNLAGGLQMILYGSGGSKQIAVVNSERDKWLNFKYVVYSVTNDDSTVSLKSCMYLEGEKIAEVDTQLNKNGAILPIDYMQIKNSSNTNRTAGTRFSAYLDDVKITDLTTTDYIYYASFDSEYSYDYIQAEGSQPMTINETVKFVDEDGAYSGYSTEICASAVADTSKIGSFKSTTVLNGFDEPLAISWKVYKQQLAWEETFENYTETDIGKVPYRLPWATGNIKDGRTLQYENAVAEKKNTVLEYAFSGTDDKWVIFNDGKTISGNFTLEFSFMLPEIVANTDCSFQILAGGHVFVEPSLYINADEEGELTFTNYNNGTRVDTVYVVKSGEIKENTWYKIKFNFDRNTNTFTYSLNDKESDASYGIRHIAAGAFDKFRFAQRTSTSKGNLKIYIDDVKTSKLITIKEPVTKNFTVYKGDEAVLPETATVLLTDGETEYEAEVTWNGSIDTSTVGTKTITGAVTGADAQATLNVEVSAYPYEIVSANLKNGSTEVFGLIKGGELSSATLNKIANDTKAGRVYAAVYDNSLKLIGANVVSIDTNAEWNKDSHKDIAITLNLPNSNDIDIDTCTLKLFVLSESLVPFANVKAMSNTDTQAATTVWIAGDSLAETKNSTDTEKGWGEAFAKLNANGVTVVNRAIGGRSSKSFYDQGLLRGILNEANAGDYLFIQFGHNDSASNDATRYTTSEAGGTFEQYITKYVTEARAKGVIPVILTPVVRAKYDANENFIGDTYDGLNNYAAAAKRVAAAYHVPMLDIHALTANKFKTMTKDSVWAYYDVEDKSSGGNPDTTHLNSDGAKLIADMIKAEMENIRLPLYKLFN